MALGQLDIHMQKIKLETCLIPYVNINSKQVKDLNVKAEIIKHLEENQVNLCDSGLGQSFLVLKKQATKEKDKLDFIKVKNFYASNDIDCQEREKTTHRM